MPLFLQNFVHLFICSYKFTSSLIRLKAHRTNIYGNLLKCSICVLLNFSIDSQSDFIHSLVLDKVDVRSFSPRLFTMQALTSTDIMSWIEIWVYLLSRLFKGCFRL